MSQGKEISRRSALKFVVQLGLVSLFADMTYEGARSITGPYLAILGASATAVGFVAGLGELIGYGFRLISGYVTDRTGKYWAMTILGYTVNLLAVPLLALTRNWEMAAFLIVAEHFGKSIRTPARDAMLSYAASQVGPGRTFGLHELLDQIGALLGPLIIAAVLYFRGSYQTSFALMVIPAVVALTVLIIAKLSYPRPRELEVATTDLHKKEFSKSFWLYLGAVGFIALGYADFPLIGYHLKHSSTVPDTWIPIFYSLAMGSDAISALILGRLFDRYRFAILIPVVTLSALFAPLVFLGGFKISLVGAALWGIGLGAQESILRAVVASLVSHSRRASAYGFFNAGYGLSWFLGSALMGMLYDYSPLALVVFSMIAQLTALPLLFLSTKKARPRSHFSI